MNHINMDSDIDDKFVDEIVYRTLHQVIEDISTKEPANITCCHVSCRGDFSTESNRVTEEITNKLHQKYDKNTPDLKSIPTLKELAQNVVDKLSNKTTQLQVPNNSIIKSDSELSSLDDSACSIEVLYSDNESGDKDNIRTSPVGQFQPEGCGQSSEGCNQSPEGCGQSPAGCSPSPAGCSPSPAGCSQSPSVYSEDTLETSCEAAFRQGFQQGLNEAMNTELLLRTMTEEKDALETRFYRSQKKWAQENELLLVEIHHLKYAYNNLVRQFTMEHPKLPEYAYETIFRNMYSNDKALATCVDLQHIINKQVLDLYNSDKEITQLKDQLTELRQILLSNEVNHCHGDSGCTGDGHISRSTLSDLIVRSHNEHKPEHISDPQLYIIDNFELGSVKIGYNGSSCTSSGQGSP